MAIANGENDMDKNEILKILETAKDENDEVPMRLVRQAFEKLPESCEDTVSRQGAIDALKDWYDGMIISLFRGVEKVIKALPSAQPELAQDLRNACIDAISRQAAIELIENESRKWGDEYGVSDVLCDLADLPAAQPEKRTNERTETHACDCVSKTSVCEILADIYPTDGEKVVAVKEVDKAYEAIQQLPSARPETIRCHDCKYRDENWRRVSVRWLPCMDVRTDGNWYCGSAERTAE